MIKNFHFLLLIFQQYTLESELINNFEIELIIQAEKGGKFCNSIFYNTTFSSSNTLARDISLNCTINLSFEHPTGAELFVDMGTNKRCSFIDVTSNYYRFSLNTSQVLVYEFKGSVAKFEMVGRRATNGTIYAEEERPSDVYMNIEFSHKAPLSFSTKDIFLKDNKYSHLFSHNLRAAIKDGFKQVYEEYLSNGFKSWTLACTFTPVLAFDSTFLFITLLCLAAAGFCAVLAVLLKEKIKKFFTTSNIRVGVNKDFVISVVKEIDVPVEHQ